MLNITDIQDVLYTWVSDVTGIETIFTNDNGPVPVDPYATIHIPQSKPVGTAESIVTLLGDDSIDIDYSNLEEIFVSINTFYENAFQTATKIKDSLARITVNDKLFAGGLGYLRATAVQNIPNVIDKEWEERAQFDCFFSTRSLDEENIATVKQIELTNELDGTTTIIE